MSEVVANFNNEDDLLRLIVERDPYLSQPGFATAAPAKRPTVDTYVVAAAGVPSYCITRPAVRPGSYSQYETN